MGKNFNIFGVDNNSSMHTDNRKNKILVFGEGPPQGLDNTKITEKAKHSIKFTRSKKTFRLSHSFLYVNGIKNINSNQI